MRDLALSVFVFSLLPLAFYRPYVGLLLWSWLGYMNPHKLTWGFAVYFPFVQMAAIATLAGLVFSKEPKRIPITFEVVVLITFIVWMLITTFFATFERLAWVQFDKVIKIQIMVFITLMLMASKERLTLLALIMALGIGFYGIKGGIFTILTGGGHRVQGPSKTFIGGNNELGLALIMVVPLFRYLQLQATHWIARWGALAGLLLCGIAAVGTQSRGALVGIVAMLTFLIMKSRKKFLFLILVAVSLPVLYAFMPQSWHDRMATIQNYEQDQSAMERIWAWQYAMRVAAENPIFGGGFEVFAGRTEAHSIYFEVLGEQGYIGLCLFLLLGISTWMAGRWIIKTTRNIDDLKWAYDLASMLQVSLIGYAVAGTFLGLAYFDLIYQMVAMMILTKIVVRRYIENPPPPKIAGEGDVVIEPKPKVRAYGTIRYDR